MTGDQLVESQAPAASADIGFGVIGVRARWWPVYRVQRLLEGRKAVAGENVAGHEVAERGVGFQPFEGLICQALPILLMQPLGCWINRRQVIFCGHFFRFVHQPVFRMHHLEPFWSPAHFAEAQYPLAAGQALLLTLAEIEETQADAAGAVVDDAYEGASAAVLNLRDLNFATDHRLLALAQ